MQKKVLNVGGNSKAIAIPEYYNGWVHHLLDIDPTGNPDIVCDARNLDQITAKEYDSVYCSHNLEHYYSHDVLKVLRGFHHILKNDGFVDIRVPDIMDVMHQVVQQGLDINDVLYHAPVGPIMVKDVLYGWGRQIEQSGVDFFAHKTGFSVKSLLGVLSECGFPIAYYVTQNLEIRVYGFKEPPCDSVIQLLNLTNFRFSRIQTNPISAKQPTEQIYSLSEQDHNRLVRERFPGNPHLEWLIWLHQMIKPKTYVEIGTESGRLLQFAQSPTKVIGIDSAMQIIYSQETWVKLFKLSSDDFFAQYNLSKVLEEKFVDLAFIDKLHNFEQALKDFINIEFYSKPKTVVVFHNTFPVVPITASRERKSNFWLGDTWKVVLILKKLRPDLKIFTIPTFPGGLTLVTGLNSKSEKLSDKFDKTVAEWMDVEVEAYLKDMNTHLNAVANDYVVVSKLLK